MAGHSKWKKVKHKKEAADAKKGKIFTTLIREITVAARKGGGDPGFNPALRVAILAAREQNMPSDNVERAIKRGTGEIEGVIFEEIFYEGYGPGGVAMIVDVLTDNKNRIVSEIRSCFTRYNGNLSASGSVAWQFVKKGLITIDKKDSKEDVVFEIALEAGAEDVSDLGDSFEIYAKSENFEKVKQAFEQARVKVASSEIAMVPQSTIHLSGKEAEQMLKLMESLEEFDDVRKVYANFDIDEKEMEKIAQE